MPYNETWPKVGLSVKDNGVTGTENTTYIQTTIRNDHFFNEDTDTDGLHKAIHSNMSGTASVPVDAVLTGPPVSDGAIYLKNKLATESLDQQDVMPFFRNSSDIMQLLGIRACGVFNSVGITNGNLCTMYYSHGLTLATAVIKNSTGVYTANFSNTLPSDKYLVLGGVTRNNSGPGNVGFFALEGASAATISTVKTTDLFNFRTFTYSGSPAATDPRQCWFVVFGG